MAPLCWPASRAKAGGLQWRTISRMSRAAVRQQSYLAKTRRGGSRQISPRSKKKRIIPAGEGIVVRAFLTVIMGAILLAGCAAKPTARSAQAVSAQEDKDSAACLEQPLKKEGYEEHQKSFASCMRARGYHEDKLYPTQTTANASNPLISDRKNIAQKSLAASDDQERAVADYNNCV